MLLWVDWLELQPRYRDATQVHAADVFHHRLCAMRIDDSGRVAFGHNHRLAPCCSAPTGRSAAEFSFWLAMPTMVGAFA